MACFWSQRHACCCAQALAYPEKVGIQAGAVNGIVLGTANGMFMFMYALVCPCPPVMIMSCRLIEPGHHHKK